MGCPDGVPSRAAMGPQKSGGHPHFVHTPPNKTVGPPAGGPVLPLRIAIVTTATRRSRKGNSDYEQEATGMLVSTPR
jgi:hypothetical protein